MTSLIRTSAVALLALAAAPAVGQENKLTPEEQERIEKNIKAAGKGATVVFFGGIALGLVVYVVPSGIAVLRRHPNAVPVILVNLLLGWTLIGWVVALVWACTAIDRGRRRD